MKRLADAIIAAPFYGVGRLWKKLWRATGFFRAAVKQGFEEG